MDKSNFVVYQITYEPTGQYYVGSTASCSKRWERHRYEMRNGRHHNRYISEVIAKSGYAQDDWTFLVISEHPTEPEARKAEERFIRLGRRSRMCLNIGRHATGGDNLSNHPDKEAIISKRRNAQLILLSSMTAAEKRQKWGKTGSANGMFGRTHSAEAKELVSKANAGHSRNKGCRRSVETRVKLSAVASARLGEANPFFGKSHSAATREKLSKANKGRKPPNQRPVSCDGESYEGVTDAARSIGVSPALVIYRIKSNKWDYHYL